MPVSTAERADSFGDVAPRPTALDTRVAGEAGDTRGALHHQFASREDLALAVVRWVEETWHAEVGRLLTTDADSVETLLAVGRGHAVYCRRDIARVLLTLRVEFTGQDHPVGRAIEEVVDRLVASCTDLIAAGRRSGAIPSGPPPRNTANGLLAALESVPIELAGRAPHDTELAERAVRGLLACRRQLLAARGRSLASTRPPEVATIAAHK